jgi:hypothetical protein
MRCPKIDYAGEGRCRERLELEVEPADDTRQFPTFSMTCPIHGAVGRGSAR